MRSLSSILKVRRGGDIGDWTEVSSGESGSNMAIAYGNNYFVIAAFAPGYVLYSQSPSVSWTRNDLPNPYVNNVYHIDYVNSYFVTTGKSGLNPNLISYSIDPTLTWSYNSSSSVITFATGVTYSSEDNLYAYSSGVHPGSIGYHGVGWGSNIGSPTSSKIVWPKQPSQSGLANIAYGNGFYMAGQTPVYYATHPSGTWTRIFLLWTATKVRFLNNYFLVCINTTGSGIGYMYDNPTNTKNISVIDPSFLPYDITYHKGYYVAVGAYGGGGALWYSTDIAGPWTKATIPAIGILKGVASGGNHIVAISQSSILVCNF